MKCHASLRVAVLTVLLQPLWTAAAQAPQEQFIAPTAAELKLAATPTRSDIWWKHAMINEIYPRSFQDSNGDGIGDLNGITERMDYLQKTGFDAIWIAPMYPSPQHDFGYDISDYEAVDPQYGTLADFDKLIASGKQHNVRVCLDMVVNHTSNEHKWFLESSSSRTNPKADWYVWNDGIKASTPGVTAYQKKYEHDGMVPPNNWESGFGGSAWEWVAARKQFYYHFFEVQQPDLNWRNPAVEKAMFDQMRFWLDRGVAGFRLDAVPTLFEDPQLREETLRTGTNAQGDPNQSGQYQENLPEVHDVMRRMRQMMDSYPGNRVLIGETYLPNTAELDKWYGGASQNELQLPMDMLVGFGDRDPNGDKLSVDHFRRYLTEIATQVHGSQPLIVFDNHDNPRSITRFGDGTHDVEIAKVIATILLTSRATALTYYGAAIGMPTTEPTRKGDVKDPIGISGWPKEKGRDGERTPMQWTSGPQAGFSTNPHTWLPIPPSYKTINVQVESGEPTSLYNWYKQLIAMRKDLPALHDGGVVMLDTANHSVLSYVRTAPDGASPVIVSMNMTAKPQTISLDLGPAGIHPNTVKTLLASDPSLIDTSTLHGITLPPFSAWIAQVQP